MQLDVGQHRVSKSRCLGLSSFHSFGGRFRGCDLAQDVLRTANRQVGSCNPFRITQVCTYSLQGSRKTSSASSRCAHAPCLPPGFSFVYVAFGPGICRARSAEFAVDNPTLKARFSSSALKHCCVGLRVCRQCG